MHFHIRMMPPTWLRAIPDTLPPAEPAASLNATTTQLAHKKLQLALRVAHGFTNRNVVSKCVRGLFRLLLVRS